jgi:hypothetical protein
VQRTPHGFIPTTTDCRLHVVESTDWRQGVIKLLEPSSPYRPWRFGEQEARPEDPVLIILNTEPCSVVTFWGVVGDDGDLANFTLAPRKCRTALLHLPTFVAVLEHCDATFGLDPRDAWMFQGENAERLRRRLAWTSTDRSVAYGHTSMAAASVLFRSDGICDCCWQTLDLAHPDAQERLHIRTVDSEMWPTDRSPVARPDWPGALCAECHDISRRGQLGNFLDMVFAQNPQCPQCGAQSTTFARFGEDSWVGNPPWIRGMGGRVVEAPKWSCLVCDHAWHS